MTTKSILTIAALALLPFAAATLPASADEGDSRMARSWTSKNSTASSNTHKRTHTSNPTTDREEPRVTSNRDDDDDNDDDNNDRGYRNRNNDGLDPAEAARIRRAHQESDGHVYMRRDRDDDDDTPSYRSGYTTTYEGYAAPKPPRRHHWWAIWD